MDFNFQRNRSDKIPREKILEELENAAKIFNYKEFGFRDFNKVSKISSGTVKNEFQAWKNALLELKTRLNKKGLDLQPRNSRSQIANLTDKKLFDEMERIWKKVGHRPSRVEWDASMPQIKIGAYRYRFNGWQNACLKFIEYKMGKTITVDEDDNIKNSSIETETKQTIIKISGDTRTVSAGLRVQVLNRDNFRCVFCGRSPATDEGVKLHIDHIIPFSKGGKTTPDNLQTLCNECNLGKSDKEKIGKTVI